MRRARVLLSALLLVGGSMAGGRASATSNLAQAPAFSLPSRDGQATLESLRGHVVLVDFWASWCAPCRASFPWMASMRQKYGARGLEVVAINLDKDRKLAEQFLAKHPAPFTVAFDPAGKSAQAFHVAAMPTSFLIGPKGEVLMTHSGFDARESAEFESRIAKALAP